MSYSYLAGDYFQALSNIMNGIGMDSKMVKRNFLTLGEL